MTCLDDAMVLGLVEGRLAPVTLADVDEHLDRCASCRDVVTLVAGSRTTGRVLARGDTIGRFVIGDLLGTGAMGRVYSAWEPELDRRVAIKVLIEDDTGARDRLVREAQAMARLNHPNVVTVHEVGTTDAGVFVVMELVEGDSLRAWAEAPRPRREVVPVLVEILRGLTAVHAAGVVHRDVKPDNMIVGKDGRVRLGDFGLARSGERSDALPLAVGTDTAVAGTPVYMAPEVLRGGPATAASDQFSFGVMAYELLAGRRPFAGTTWAELLASIERGDIAVLPGAPAWLDAAIRRCLAVDPVRRFESVQAIADHLAHLAIRRHPMRWVAAALATSVLASAATFAMVRDDGTGARTCKISASDVGWAPEQRASYRLLGEPALGAIDRWVTSWKDERRDACRAATSGASARIAARERCLDERRAEFAALITRLDPKTAPQAAETSSHTPKTAPLAAETSPHAPNTSPQVAASSPHTPKTATQAIDALAALPPPLDCRSAQVDAAIPLPLDPERAAAARDVITALPAIRAAIAVGDSRTIITRTDELVARARTSDHAPTLADVLLVQADALRAIDRLADATLAARDAVAAATRGRADATAARAWIARVAIAGDRRDLAVAEDYGALAQAAVDRAGSPPHLAATLTRLRGLVAYNRGDLDAARALLADARTQFVAVSGARSIDVAAVESALGSVARQAGDLDEAERRHRAALAIDRELRGDSHRDIARDYHNIAGVLRLRGELTAALDTYYKALAVEVATQGKDSIAAALTHNSIGLVLMARSQWEPARTELTLARDLLAAAGHGDRAFAEHNLGLVEQALGRHRAALAHFARAADVYATTIGATAPAAVRLVEDRAVSEAAVKGAIKRANANPVEALQLPPPPQSQPQPKPQTQPKPVAGAGAATGSAKPTAKDVGVYGSSQTW